MRHAGDTAAGCECADAMAQAPTAQPVDEQLGKAYEAMACGVLVVDGDWEVVDANAAAERILGASFPALRGRPYQMTHPDWSPLSRDERPTYVALRTGRPQRDTLLGLIRPDGERRHICVDAVPIYDDGGTVSQVVVSFVDVTERVRAEEALRLSEERFRALTEQGTDLVAIIDAEGHVHYVSPSHRTVLGYDPASLVGRHIFDLVHPDDRPLIGERIKARLDGTEQRAVEYRIRDAAGAWRWLESVSRNALFDPAVRGIVVTSRDVTQRRRDQEAIRSSEERFRAVFEQAAVGIAIESLDGRFLRVNDRLCMLLGYAREELGDRCWQDVTRPDDTSADHDGVGRLLAGGDHVYVTDKRYIRKDGSEFWGHLTLTLVRDAAGRPDYYIAVVEDIALRKQAEAELLRQAHHDALTRLPNRALLHERTEQAIRLAQRSGAPLGLLLLDLDRFKEVNDTFGHHYGDLLLQQVACRLQETVRTSDTVARLGGDEFAILLPSADRCGAIAAAVKITAAVQAPLVVGDQTLYMGSSIGIALCGEHGSDPHTLLRRADVAMYVAKRGEQPYALYTPDQDAYTPERLALIDDLRRAIAQDELVLHYQPKVDLATGRAGNIEALVRWQHPRRGVIPPDQFIPLAEQTGLIAPLTLWVLEAAVRQCRRWREAGLQVGVAVNLSTRTLHDSDLPATIAGLLQRCDVPPSCLRVEVTESALMADTARAQDVLTRLAALGVGISVDDYGTGYSSLAYLKRLPVDELKIDMSFVRHMIEDEADAAIVASTIGLGHSLGLRVVAEGVETQDTYGLLASMGCDAAQGYHLGHPLPTAEIEQWLCDQARIAHGVT